MNTKRFVDDEAYIFVPISSDVTSQCQYEASQIYCSINDTTSAISSCMKKLPSNNDCLNSPDSCWQLQPLGGPCPTEQECMNPSAVTCIWYAVCLQRRYGCPASDYPLGYGYHYCSRFVKNRSQFTQEGQEWINRTLVCLQQALVPAYENPTNCGDLQNFAYYTHPQCYLGVTPNFCEVAPNNILQLVEVYLGDNQDWIKFAKGWQQMIEVMSDCVVDNLKIIIPAFPLVIQP